MNLFPCRECPLRANSLFIVHSNAELALIESLKRDQTVLPADSGIIDEGRTDAPLYTLLTGWAFRFKTLSDGRRQILNFLLPGDFIGVQQKMGDAAAHGVPFQFTQQHIADGLGLSLVHTNKTLRKLERRRLHRIEDGRLHLLDVKALGRIADL